MTTTSARTTPGRIRTRRGTPLDAGETADAAVTAALVVALLAAGRVLAAGSMFQVIASFVVAVLAARRRTRAVAVSSTAAAAIALILGGLGPVTQAALAGVFGWCGGQGLKRGWGRTRSVLFSLAIAWPAMVASVMLVFPAVAINRKLRELVFENVENQADGIANMLGGVGSIFGTVGLGVVERALNRLGGWGQDVADFLIENWLLLIPATEFVYALVYALLIRAVGGAVLRRLERALVEPITIELQDGPDADPVPVALEDVVLERNGVAVTRPVSLRIEPDEHVVVQGPNGAGKSTILDTLAGIDNLDAPIRSGASALGHRGGTARVGQRPEAQVVGTTVGEDLRWGLDEPVADDALSRVGLDLPDDRPTSELSGGELQRLALASALRREPRLLLADEITSMLDPDEQANVLEQLDRLDGAAIVRTTHRNDAASGDRVVHIERLETGAAATPSVSTPPAAPSVRTFPATAPPDSVPAPLGPPSNGGPSGETPLRTIHTTVTSTRLIRLRDVGYAHAHDKPWALPVLHGVDLSIHRYELVVIEGRNGSGKTTLARIIAGLEDATAGTVERTKGVRRALAQQHVRLQLLKPTVTEELHSLAGVRTVEQKRRGDDDFEAEQHTRAVNLRTSIELFDLERLLDRRIDELSGGEQRRVLLAGLVARGVSLLVLDEPLAGLDAEGRRDLAETLDHVRLAGTSIVAVSHDVDWQPLSVHQHLRLDGGRLVPAER